MRLGFILLPAALAAGFSSLVLPSFAFAQEPASTLAAAHDMPETPQPQFALVEAKQPVRQNPPGQSQAARNNASFLIASLEPGAEMSADNEPAASPVAPAPEAGDISGTVLDVNGDIVPGVAVVLEGIAAGEHRMAMTDKSGFFQFRNLKPGGPYQVKINVLGFASFSSPTVSLNPGQFLVLTTIKLQIAGEVTSVKVYSSNEQIATEQVRVEEQQRIFGIIPNFYVVYDQNPVPLTTKLKYKLALRVSVDPISILGVGFTAGMYQAADTPDYVQGAKGYGQRFGAIAADSLTDIMIGGAILPSLLHQDPRYFYQGTGTNKSRALHALASPFRCRGDNGNMEWNYSTIGGDLASSAISNAYYPQSNRGVGLVVSNVLIGTAERVTSDLVQEFILRKFTSSKAKDQN